MNKIIIDNNAINKFQFGFKPRYSTTLNLLASYSQVNRCLDDREPISVLFFAFKKAFDKVCHSIFLDKLISLNISK